MPKSVNSIDCRCGGHYVKKNRSKHMETNKHQTYIQNLDFIDWDDMDFGTERSSFCGICGKREEGYFKNGELQRDIICHDCYLVWEYDEDSNRYGKRDTYLCRHCEDTTTDPDECDNCGYSPELGNCPDKECEMCYGDDEDQYNQPCSNGCGTILAENVGIYLLSKEGEEDEQWCSTCFYDCGKEAREDGWTFDEDGERELDEMCYGDEDTSQGADTKFHCDIHKETLLVHDGDGGRFCRECGFSYE